MKKLCLVATLLLASIAAVAQGASEQHVKAPAPKSSITVNVNGLSCQTTAGTSAFSVLAWSWGASNSSSGVVGGGGGTGKASVSDLNIMKQFDQCSPALFGAVVTGKHFNALTLTQDDSNGNVLLTVTLTDVLVSSWQMSGSASDASPTESVSFNFAKVCIAETAGGTKFCYDIAQNKTF